MLVCFKRNKPTSSSPLTLLGHLGFLRSVSEAPSYLGSTGPSS